MLSKTVKSVIRLLSNVTVSKLLAHQNVMVLRLQQERGAFKWLQPCLVFAVFLSHTDCASVKNHVREGLCAQASPVLRVPLIRQRPAAAVRGREAVLISWRQQRSLAARGTREGGKKSKQTPITVRHEEGGGQRRWRRRGLPLWSCASYFSSHTKQEGQPSCVHREGDECWRCGFLFTDLMTETLLGLIVWFLSSIWVFSLLHPLAPLHTPSKVLSVHISHIAAGLVQGRWKRKNRKAAKVPDWLVMVSYSLANLLIHH